MSDDKPRIRYVPDPDNPGWHTWNLADDTRFNAQTMGHMLVRKDGDKLCRVRMFPERRHTNLLDMVHGAITLALMDVALFASMRILLEGDAAGSVTLELSSQFIGAGRPGVPLDALVEVMRETKRLVFMRGTVVQGEADDHMVASFSGIVRKPSGK
ncbi:PaaI family thioesterase [Novosphingobium sp.]|uniref:PaaI family thioesterase n=1 Tax=Novosphingobium sp. TaxID=1874826 RepID=UPI00273498C7|nr:PaaI family thioesterase [Novosphingobium sp.]MDP3906079.1 PaaI family thioesterase [Novosphingobium sp.]